MKISLKYSNSANRDNQRYFSSDAPIMSDIRDFNRTLAKMRLRGVATHTRENILTCMEAGIDQFTDIVY